MYAIFPAGTSSSQTNTLDVIYRHINAWLSIFPPPWWQLDLPVFNTTAHIVFVGFTVQVIVFRHLAVYC